MVARRPAVVLLSSRPVPSRLVPAVVALSAIGGAALILLLTRLATGPVLALLRGFWNVLPGSSWEAGPALGVGAYHLAANSEVEPPLVAESDEVWSFALSAGLDAELFLTDALSLNAGLSVLFLTPRPAVAIAGPPSDAASPLLAGTLGLGVSF